MKQFYPILFVFIAFVLLLFFPLLFSKKIILDYQKPYYKLLFSVSLFSLISYFFVQQISKYKSLREENNLKKELPQTINKLINMIINEDVEDIVITWNIVIYSLKKIEHDGKFIDVELSAFIISLTNHNLNLKSKTMQYEKTLDYLYRLKKRATLL